MLFYRSSVNYSSTSLSFSVVILVVIQYHFWNNSHYSFSSINTIFSVHSKCELN